MTKLIRSRVAFGVLVAGVSLATPGYARNWCTSGDLNGYYGLIGSRLLTPGVTIAPPGTTGAATPGNMLNPDSLIGGTAVGDFFRGSISPGPFAAIGVVLADGAGNLLAQLTDSSANLAPVGTYTVNADCTVSVRLRDNDGAGPDLFGVLVGDQVKLIQTGAAAAAPPGTTGAMLPTPVPTTLVTLRRMAANNACNNGSLNGAYGMAISGLSSLAAPAAGGDAGASLAPFTHAGRFYADGAGSFVLDATGAMFPQHQITGTYSVSSDCTGTARFMIPPGASLPPSQGGTAQAETRNVRFILGDRDRSLHFVFTDADTMGTGTAEPQ